MFTSAPAGALKMQQSKKGTRVEGFDEFVRTEHPRLVRALTLYVGDEGIAWQLAQDAFVRAGERWGQVSAMAAPGAWTHRVGMNLANSHFRRRAAERRANRRATGRAERDEPPVDPGDALAVRAALALLPPREREVVVLRFFLDYSVADTATALGLRAGSVKTTTHRALQRLRAELGADLITTEETDDARRPA
jgi:RNA polymerase sigma-70 factor (sigma-E family)